MIEKNIRLQPHHSRDLLVGRRSDGRRPKYQPPGHRDAPSPSRGGPPGGGGGHHSPPSRPSPAPSRPAPAPSRPAPSPHRDPTPAPTVAQTAAMEDIGSKDTIASLTSGPSPHGDRDANIQEQKKLDIQQMIAKQQEEKYGDTADPTKFGETISDIDRVTSKDEKDYTIEDKRIIEDWEKDQDWDKVEELADRGESFEDIQSAMNKGLLLKEDAIRRQGLIERGLAAVMPKTKLESGLLSNLKSKFDPKSMIGNVAKNFALRKLGLGWLNPLMGLASLFGIPQRIRTARQKPKFDTKKASQLGLYADRQPTDTTKYARVGEGTIGDKIARGEVDLAKLITGNNLSDIKGQQAVLGKAPLIQMRMLERKIKAPDIYGKPTPREKRMYEKLKEMQKEEKVYKLPILTAADGGRIDSPLTGRNRYI